MEKSTTPITSYQGTESGGTLLPMLIVGLLCVTIGGLAIMAFV